MHIVHYIFKKNSLNTILNGLLVKIVELLPPTQGEHKHAINFLLTDDYSTCPSWVVNVAPVPCQPELQNSRTKETLMSDTPGDVCLITASFIPHNVTLPLYCPRIRDRVDVSHSHYQAMEITLQRQHSSVESSGDQQGGTKAKN